MRPSESEHTGGNQSEKSQKKLKPESKGAAKIAKRAVKE